MDYAAFQEMYSANVLNECCHVTLLKDNTITMFRIKTILNQSHFILCG